MLPLSICTNQENALTTVTTTGAATAAATSTTLPETILNSKKRQ